LEAVHQYDPMFRQNTSLVIIHLGNLEYICVRHRSSQTLYVSDILHVPRLKNPGYGKLQVGLYISAVDDAMSRVDLDDLAKLATPRNNSATETAPKSNGYVKLIKSPTKRARRSGRGRPRKRGSGDNARNFTDDESSDDAKSSRNVRSSHNHSPLRLILALQSIKLKARSRAELYLRHGTTSVTLYPARFHRGPHEYTDSDKSSTPDATPDDVSIPPLLLNLASRLGHGATGVTHEGFVQTDFEPGHAKLKVAAKLAFTDDQQEDIAHEHDVYMHLESQSVSGIPTVYGIFHDTELETGPSCLLMPHAGMSLRARESISSNTITFTQR
jgi:hypothetical protein